MKKIMFNDKYGLTDAVLNGRKTMTRRIVPDGILRMANLEVSIHGGSIEERIRDHSPFLCEDVAVAQKYKDTDCDPNMLQLTFVKKPAIFPELDAYKPLFGWIDLPLKYQKGWTNKMFVITNLMPHRIRITNYKVERLQDISDEDCLHEGVEKWLDCYIVAGIMENRGKNNKTFNTAREAFATLIDKVSGKDTWEHNPWVYAYEFKLLK